MCVTSALGGFAGPFFSENGPFIRTEEAFCRTEERNIRAEEMMVWGENYEIMMCRFYITNNSVLIY
jgi:hypothetical protein